MSTDSKQDQLTPEQQKELMQQIAEADKLMNPPEPPLPEPDFVHRGSIPYRIEWRGKKAHILVENNLSFNDRVFMLYIVQKDFEDLQDAIKAKKNDIHKNFKNDEKQAIAKARFMLDKFINRFLGIIYTDMMKSKEVPVPTEVTVPKMKVVPQEEVKSETVTENAVPADSKQDENL